MKKILHVLDNLDIGGVQNYIINHYRKIDKGRVHFDFLTFNDKKMFYANEIQKNGGRIFTISYKIFTPLFAKALRNLLLKEKYDCIHCHCNFLNFFILVLAKKCGVKIRISHAHASYKASNIISLIFRFLFKTTIGFFATHLCACSLESGIWLYGKHNAQKIIVMKNGVDSNLFEYSLENSNEIRKEFGIPLDSYVVINIGSLTKIKNQIFLLKLFSKISAHSEFWLIIVGDGPLLNEYKTKARTLGIDKKVIFTGMQENVKKFLDSSDCFVLPSFNEGFPVSSIEAQYNGLHCIFSNGIPNSVDFTNNCEFISIKNENAYIEALLKKTKRLTDKVVYNDFDINTTTKELVNLYLESDK